MSILFCKIYILKARTRRRLDQREEVSAINRTACQPCAGSAGLANAFGVGSAMRFRIALGRIGAAG